MKFLAIKEGDQTNTMTMAIVFVCVFICMSIDDAVLSGK